uniref:(northern house mosquito) hypothetical protein n=1 Tax=Culex pipiens TaxID=7175 RepID=A0A8D8B135_CULPI
MPQVNKIAACHDLNFHFSSRAPRVSAVCFAIYLLFMLQNAGKICAVKNCMFMAHHSIRLGTGILLVLVKWLEFCDIEQKYGRSSSSHPPFASPICSFMFKTTIVSTHQ